MDFEDAVIENLRCQLTKKRIESDNTDHLYRARIVTDKFKASLYYDNAFENLIDIATSEYGWERSQLPVYNTQGAIMALVGLIGEAYHTRLVTSDTHLVDDFYKEYIGEKILSLNNQELLAAVREECNEDVNAEKEEL